MLSKKDFQKSNTSDLNSRHRTMSLLFTFKICKNFLYSHYNNDCRIIVQQTKLNMESYPLKYKSTQTVTTNAISTLDLISI